MVHFDLPSSWFDYSRIIDMGKDEGKLMFIQVAYHLSCIWYAAYNILKKGNYISNFDIIIASEMRINRCLFFFVVVGIFILFLKMYGLCQRSSLGIPTHFIVTNLNFFQIFKLDSLFKIQLEIPHAVHRQKISTFGKLERLLRYWESYFMKFQWSQYYTILL